MSGTDHSHDWVYGWVIFGYLSNHVDIRDRSLQESKYSFE